MSLWSQGLRILLSCMFSRTALPMSNIFFDGLCAFRNCNTKVGKQENKIKMLKAILDEILSRFFSGLLTDFS